MPFTATHLIRHASLVEVYSVCRDILGFNVLRNHKDLRATQKYAKVRDTAVEKTQVMVDQRVCLSGESKSRDTNGTFFRQNSHEKTKTPQKHSSFCRAFLKMAEKEGFEPSYGVTA